MQKKILNSLIDKYEKSKIFNGTNKVNRSITVQPERLFLKYSDSAEYEVFLNVNQEILSLETKGFVSVSRKNNDYVSLITLNTEAISAVYTFLARKPRFDEQQQLLDVLGQYENLDPVLTKYVDVQRKRVADNKNVEFFDSKLGFDAYRDVLKAVDYLVKNEEEILIRNASIFLFKDSKRLEGIASSVESLLRKYGDFEGSEDILRECNVLKTPTQVLVKGNGVIVLQGQSIDLSMLEGDIGFSTKTLPSIETIIVNGGRIVTVENLTSFFDYHNGDDLVIYLGGFHNTAKREFIKKIYATNPDKKYCHFGDIDAGGFYILEDLRNKTGIHFESLCMDVQTLQEYKDFTKKLTAEDRKRLQTLGERDEFRTVVEYMLANDCKLEQENITARQ